MSKKLHASLGLAALIISAVTLAHTQQKKSVKDVLADVEQAIGADKLNSVQYSTTHGTWYWNGQSYRPSVTDPWSEFALVNYTRVFDYQKGASQEQFVRTESAENFKKGQLGGGLKPIKGTASRNSFLSGDTAWDVPETTNKPGPAGGPASGGNFLISAVDDRQLQMVITPHGFVKAAMAAGNPTIESKNEKGKHVRVISFVYKNKYKVNGYVNDQNLVEKVETWYPETVVGDELVEAIYSNYKDFSGIKFPMKIVQRQDGRPVLDLTVEQVNPNAAVNIVAPPDLPKPVQQTVVTEKLFDGLWAMRLGTQSLIIEFPNYVVVGEGGGNDNRTMGIIEAVKKVIPNKPIRYVIHTHHHHDHSGGLRAWVAEGATLIMSANSVPYYQAIFKRPHTLAPDRLSQNPKPLKTVAVKDKWVLSDGDRTVEFYFLPGIHATSTIAGYLPKEGIFFTGDSANPPDYVPPPPPDKPLDLIGLIGYKEWLFGEIKRLHLDVRYFMNAHVPGLKTPEQQRQSIEFENTKIERFDKEHPEYR